MKDPIIKLAGMGGPALGTAHAAVPSLRRLLAAKNGFYAFEGALHVFPDAPGVYGLTTWNAPAGWRASYEGLADGCVFFAEDVFGGQFCLFDGVVMSFDPETGEKEFIAATVEGWAERILADFEVLTGCTLAHDWQAKNGQIPPGHRLVPKVPFVLGGEYEIENLFALEAARAMRSRANLATQIRDLPDGTKVTFKIVD